MSITFGQLTPPTIKATNKTQLTPDIVTLMSHTFSYPANLQLLRKVDGEILQAFIASVIQPTLEDFSQNISFKILRAVQTFAL